MHSSKRLQKLGVTGVSHHVLLPILAIVLVIGIGGNIMQRSSSAATAKPCVDYTFSTKKRNNNKCNTYIGSALKPKYFSGTPSKMYSISLAKAVKKFQTAYSLKSTGTVNGDTWKKICTYLHNNNRTTVYGQIGCSSVTAASPATQTPTATTTPNASAGHTFTVATWNANADNVKIVGDQLLEILGNTQIIGIQSLHHLDQRDSVKNTVICSTCKYAGYLPGYNNNTATPASYPIIWDKAVFSQVGDGGYRTMSDSLIANGVSYAARYATWVKLQSKVNGKRFYVVNTQLISGVESVGKPTGNTAQVSNYKTHLSNLTTLISELKSADVPIYIVGNFAVNYRYDKDVHTSYFPYAAFKALGIHSNWELTNLKGIAKSAGTQTEGSRLIDYVFTWQRSDVAANTTSIAGSSYGSTYKPVYFTSTMQ